MIFNCSCAILVLALMILFLCFVFPIKMSFYQIRFIWWSFILGLAMFSYYAEPSASDDLFRHYQNMDVLWTGNYDNPLIIWKLILASISISGHKGLLPALAICVIGGATYGIMSFYKEHMENNIRIFPIYVIVIFGFCSIFAMISGVRNSSIAAVWSYAYIKYYKNNKKRFYIIVFLLSFIHLSPLFPTFFLLISDIYRKVRREIRIWIILILGFWPLILQQVSRLLINIRVDYFQLLVGKINIYFNNNNLYQNPWYILPKINCIFLFILLLLLRHKNKKKKYLFELLFIFGIFTSSFWYSIILERMLMFIGFITLPILGDTYKLKNKIMLILIIIISAIMLLFYFNALIAHVTFNNINIYKLLGRR